jgi:hypothetical protein
MEHISFVGMSVLKIHQKSNFCTTDMKIISVGSETRWLLSVQVSKI